MIEMWKPLKRIIEKGFDDLFQIQYATKPENYKLAQKW